MKIYLREISENTKDFHYTENDEWIRTAIEAADEKGAIDVLTKLRPAHLALPKRPITVDFHVRILDRVIFVNGEFDTALHLLCSRCGKPFLYPMNHHFEALLTQDRDMAGEPESDDLSKQFGKAHQGRVKLESELEITHLREDFVDLSQVLTEQLVLQVPFQPLCEDDCKGVCFQCGADLNEGSCSCDRHGHSVFAALKDWKIQKGSTKTETKTLTKEASQDESRSDAVKSEGQKRYEGALGSGKPNSSKIEDGPQRVSPFSSLKGLIKSSDDKKNMETRNETKTKTKTETETQAKSQAESKVKSNTDKKFPKKS